MRWNYYRAKEEPRLCGGMKNVQGKAEVGSDRASRRQLKRSGASGRRGLRQLGVLAEVVGDLENRDGKSRCSGCFVEAGG